MNRWISLPMLLLWAGLSSAEDYSCLLQPWRVVELSAAVEGLIARVEVEEGDAVSEGQLLVMLDASVEKARLEQARLRAESTAGLDVARVTLERAQEKYQRAQDLSSDQFVSSDELSDLGAQLEISRLNVHAEQEKLALARAALDQSDALYRQRLIHSPLDGVVVHRYMHPGEFVSGQPMLRLARLDPLLVEVVLPAELHGQIQPGSQAQLHLDAPLNTDLPARVDRIEPVMDAASNTFAARLRVDNPKRRIPAGINCRVRFQPEGDQRP